jgi:hypothetical protein
MNPRCPFTKIPFETDGPNRPVIDGDHLVCAWVKAAKGNLDDVAFCNLLAQIDQHRDRRLASNFQIGWEWGGIERSMLHLVYDGLVGRYWQKPWHITIISDPERLIVACSDEENDHFTVTVSGSALGIDVGPAMIFECPIADPKCSDKALAAIEELVDVGTLKVYDQALDDIIGRTFR